MSLWGWKDIVVVIREKSHCTILPWESRNQESAQIPMVKWCNGIFLWSKIEPHTGLGFCDHRVILFTPGHAHQLTSSVWLRRDDLFSGWTVSIWRHDYRTRGARFLIREKSHSTILPLESRNQESALGEKSTDSWFLDSNGKMVQWDFSPRLIM